MTNFEIIFDNGGGATLQVNGNEYVHAYDDMRQLADDVAALVDGADVSDWDNNQPECYIDDETFWRHKPNGGYRALDQDNWRDDHTDSSWGNIKDFSAAVRSSME